MYSGKPVYVIALRIPENVRENRKIGIPERVNAEFFCVN
jgi:hypothetical protein